MKQNLIAAGLLSLGLIACGQPSAKSSLDGHYEASTAAAAAKFRGQQVVPPEYAPSQGVIVSSALLSQYGREDLVKAILDAGAEKVWVTVSRGSSASTSGFLFSGLRATLGSRISQVQPLPQKDSGSLTVWARDWSPLPALTADGKLRILDLNYYPSRPADDSTGRTFESLASAGRVSVPVYNEGGNFMNNTRGECLMTTRVTDANASVMVSGDMVLDAEDVSGYYRDFAGCSKVHIFPRLPGERTGHIDMWAKFMDDDTVIVNEISDTTLSYANNQSYARQIQSFLDARALEIEALGYNVVRIPMPAPRNGLYRSYTNSLFVNGTAILPRYVRSYEDSRLVAGYEAEVIRIYQSLGYKTTWIPSDELIASGGAVHCVTMQIPSEGFRSL